MVIFFVRQYLSEYIRHARLERALASDHRHSKEVRYVGLGVSGLAVDWRRKQSDLSMIGTRFGSVVSLFIARLFWGYSKCREVRSGVGPSGPSGRQ